MHRVVVINCFDTYEHRVELLKRYFISIGMDVQVITSDWRHFHKTTRTEFPAGYEAIHVKPYLRNLSIDRLYSHHCFAKDALKRTQELAPELLWVLVPPNSLVKAAAAYKEKYPKTKLVFDFIDMWPETMPISKLKTVPPFSFWRDIRDKYVYAGDAIVTECELYQCLLKKNCGLSRMHTLYLARDIIPVIPKPDLPKDRIALCYLGSINNIIDIPCIGQIIRKIGMPVDLHIIGEGEKKQQFIEEATAAGANVIFHGKVYDQEEKKRIFDRCHFGLNVMKKSVFVGLTMKSMDYFEYGIPIINTIKGDTWDFVDQYALGINYEDKTEFCTEELIEISHRREGVRGFFVEHFSYDSFKKCVEQVFHDLHAD